MEADGSQIRPITKDPQWACGHPAWSPDGGELVFFCRSAAACGGVSSVGTELPECTRRIFRKSADDWQAPATQISDRDASAPAVSSK